MAYSIPYDTTIFVRDSIRDVVKTLFEAVGLVALVVLVFLQSWRASLVPLLAIPVSLVGTFAVMAIFGFSLNNLSLFGLVLAIGIVVDDAIVVVENVDRWIEHGLSPREAAYRAMQEVTPAVIAIAFGLTAVFVPVAFISGITGQFYRQFALTISFSTLLSAFNSLTLSPALAALILKPHDGEKGLAHSYHRLRARLVLSSVQPRAGEGERRLRGDFEACRAAVDRGAGGLCRFDRSDLFRIQDGAAGIHSAAGSGLSDRGGAVAGCIVDRSNRRGGRSACLTSRSKIPGIHDTFGVTGFNLLTGTNQTNTATMFLPLNEFDERAGKPAESAAALTGRLMGAFSQVQEAFSLVLSPPPVRGIGQAGGFKMQVEDRSGLATPQQLEAATGALIADARKDPRITSLFSTFRASVPQLYANVDRVKAKKENVAVTDIFQALQVYLGSYYINDFNYLGRTYKVIAQADAPFRAHAVGCRAIEDPQRRRGDGAAGNRDGAEGHHRCRPDQSV